ADLKAKQAEMLATYSPHSRAMATINAGVATAQREVATLRREAKRRSIASPNVVHQTLQTDLLRTSADAKAQGEPVRVLQTQLDQINQRLNDLQANRGQFDNLTRERQIAEDTYKSLSTQFEDARVKDNLNQKAISPATVISAPTLPYKPAWPRPLLTIAVCFVAGIILAIAAILALEALDDRFSTAEQVAFILDLPVLGSFERRRLGVTRHSLLIEAQNDHRQTRVRRADQSDRAAAAAKIPRGRLHAAARPSRGGSDRALHRRRIRPAGPRRRRRSVRRRDVGPRCRTGRARHGLGRGQRATQARAGSYLHRRFERPPRAARPRASACQ